MWHKSRLVKLVYAIYDTYTRGYEIDFGYVCNLFNAILGFQFLVVLFKNLFYRVSIGFFNVFVITSCPFVRNCNVVVEVFQISSTIFRR